MTKTLTEQWREGTLTCGLYYLKLKDGLIFTDRTRYEIGEKMYRWENSDYHYVSEVLAPVPSYERIKDLDRLEQFCELIIAGEKQEWENIVKRGDRKEMAKWLNERKNKTVDRLEKKLEIATKALKDVAYLYIYTDKDLSTVANNALKEMEGVK